MRFVTKELFEQHDSSDKTIIQKAYQDRLDDYYANVRDRLPKSFVVTYEAHEGFHDFCIKEVRLRKSEKKTLSICVKIKFADLNYKITYKDVSEFRLNSSDIKISGKHIGLWYVDEFQLIADNLFLHEIMMLEKGGLEIKFKSISIKKA